MSSIYSEKNLATIKKVRNVYLKGILWLLVALLVFWVITVLVTDKVFDTDGVIGKAQTMFLTFIGCALLNIGAFKCIEAGNDKSKSFALVSLAAAIVAVVLDVLLIWEVFPGITEVTRYGSGYSVMGLSVGAKATICMALTAFAAWVEACIMRNSSSVARVIMSVILGISYISYLISIIGIDFSDKFTALLLIIPIGSSLIYLVSTRIAKLEGKEKKTAPSKATNLVTNKDEMQIRAEIEEKVRREMIEKEVREKLEAEQAAKESPKE